MLTAGRRQRGYFLRWIYAAVLLLQIAPRLIGSVWYEWQRPGSSTLGLFVEFFNHTFAAQHFVLLFIVTPALTAGAIADEKLRGTLDYLLTTCLHPAEIILGKLAARTCQVMVLAMVPLPLICFFGVIVDLPLVNVAALYIASAVVVAGTAAVSVLASVWCHRTRDAVLWAYLALFAGYCLGWAATSLGWDGLTNAFNPLYAIDRDRDMPLAARLALLSVAWLLPASGCVALASWRLRPAYAQMRQATRVGWARWRLQPMRDNENPVSWRERCVHGIAPLARLRTIPLWLALPAFAFASAASLLGLVLLWLSSQADLLGAFQREGIAGLHVALALGGVDAWTVASIQAGVTLCVMLLLLTVRASGSMTDERERGAWDQLLLTPLTTKEIVHGKLWGLLRAYVPYVIVYALATLPLAFLIGAEAFVVCTFAASAMAVAAPFIVTVGLYWSAHLSSSWRSLLATIGSCYAYLIVAGLLGSGACMFGCFLRVMMMALRPLFQDILPNADILIGGLAGIIAMIVLNAMVIAPLAWALILWTEAKVDKAERARVSAADRKHLKLRQVADELAREAPL
jgi:ABC-type transport system involved in multi-copper enzyme maturation permease subunit